MTEDFLSYYILTINSLLIGYIVGAVLFLIYLRLFK